MEAHDFQSLIDGLDNCWGGVMGVEGRGPRRFVFFGSESFQQFLVLGSPGGFILVKGIGKSAPAYILGENSLFFWRGGTVLSFNIV